MGWAGSDLFREIVAVLGPAIENSVEPSETLAKRLLSEAPRLVVIDNFESVRDEPLLVFLRDQLPSPSKVLVTSRHHLQVGERVVNLEGMDSIEAVALLRQEADRLGIALTGKDEGHLELIAKVGHGVPLVLRWVMENVRDGRTLDWAIGALKQATADDIFVTFISYSHDSAAHKGRVLDLAQRLRGDGIDCRLDRFVNGAPPEGWPLWMERQVASARFVIVVASATYLRRYEGREQPGVGRGAIWEAILARQDLYEAQGENRKFVPVLFEGAVAGEVPKSLRPFTLYHLFGDYDKLLRYMLDQPLVVPAPIGRRRKLPPSR
jgi:hypothetical protein